MKNTCEIYSQNYTKNFLLQKSKFWKHVSWVICTSYLFLYWYFFMYTFRGVHCLYISYIFCLEKYFSGVSISRLKLNLFEIFLEKENQLLWLLLDGNLHLVITFCKAKKHLFDVNSCVVFFWWSCYLIMFHTIKCS